MEFFRDVAEIAQLLWPLVASILTLVGLGLLFMARRVLVFREEMYDKNGKRLFTTRDDLNRVGERINMLERVASASEQRGQANERQIEILQERDRQMMDRFANELVQPLREITKDLKEHGKMIADIRDRVSRIEGRNPK